MPSSYPGAYSSITTSKRSCYGKSKVVSTGPENLFLLCLLDDCVYLVKAMLTKSSQRRTVHLKPETSQEA